MKLNFFGLKRFSCHLSSGGGIRSMASSERGFTLQTLIVTAVLVLVAVAASVVIVALTRSSSDDFTEAGNTDLEARCRPNEVWSPEYDARGEAGINTKFYEYEVERMNSFNLDPATNIPAAWRTWSQIEAEVIGCNPVCGTWEYFDPGRAAAGTGGPEGRGGVFSSDEGCFPPCYMRRHDFNTGDNRNHPNIVANPDNFSLHYWDDNRVPPAGYVRLGVVYRRNSDLSQTGATHTDMIYRGANNNSPRRIYRLDHRRGAVNPGYPLTPAMLANNTIGPLGAVSKPDWEGASGTENSDNDLEVRADPSTEECRIVDTSDDDSLFCSSNDSRCA